MDDAEAERAVARAIEAGYRLVDSAANYGNETGVGRGVRAGGAPREEVVVTTKLPGRHHGYEETLTSFDESLERLGLDYVDLYLIHWPAPAQELYVESWEALVEAHRAGQARSIGVSNFLPEHLDRIIEATGETPSVNQIELHPQLQQQELRDYHSARGILTEAWSPLAQGQLLRESTIVEIASALERTPAQVVLRWHIQLGNVVIPKSVTPERIEENFALFDFELSSEHMETIGRLDRGERIGPDPASFG
jgi:diketogulonate reductase-like aldo/keto reductase